MKNKIKLIDCTLRDGGYYNNWKFDKKLVKKYLLAMKNTGIDYVEIGFRTNKVNKIAGENLFTTEAYLKKLNLPKNLKYATMINASHILNNVKNIKLEISSLFENREYSLISLVRVAINFDDVHKSEYILKCIKNLGYEVALNMMQSHGKTKKQYARITKLVSKWGCVDILYFADSLGSMLPNDIMNISNSIKISWGKAFGIHAHNNKNLALINTITAINNGATWIDSTVAGMGRGAGNVPTENLLMELSHLNLHRGNVKLLNNVIKDFEILKKKYNWGPNIYYQYAANNEIHPTFVQSLLSDKRYDNSYIFKVLELLSRTDSSQYSLDNLQKAIYNNEIVQGTWNATGWLKGKSVLVIGGGPSVKKYKEKIINYIHKSKPYVIFLNINSFLDSKLGNATIISHEARTIFDLVKYKNLNHLIIMPKGRFENLFNHKLDNLDILDYGLNISDENFKINEKSCSIKWSLTAAYALAVITQAEPCEINLIGFDGYTLNDIRYKEMNEVFDSYSKIKSNISIKSLTPTLYDIKESLVFIKNI